MKEIAAKCLGSMEVGGSTSFSEVIEGNNWTELLKMNGNVSSGIRIRISPQRKNIMCVVIDALMMWAEGLAVAFPLGTRMGQGEACG